MLFKYYSSEEKKRIFYNMQMIYKGNIEKKQRNLDGERQKGSTFYLSKNTEQRQ